MNIKTKIAKTYSLYIIISFLLISTFTIFTVFNETNKTNSTLSSQLFNSKANEVSDWLLTNVNQIEIIEQASEIQNFDLEQIKLFVDNLNLTVGLSYGNQWGTFAIGDESGIGYVSKHEYIDISSRSYFQEGKLTNKQYILSIPVISKTDQADIALIHYPLRKDGIYFGFINAAINLEKLTDICESISFYDGTSFIIDDSGNLYTKTKNIDEKDIETTLSLASTNKTSLSQRKNTYFCTKINNTDNWYLCTKVSNSVLYASLTRLIIILFIIFIILMIVSLIESIYISKSISKPIVELNSVMQNASNNLEAVAPQSSISEINSLANSFNSLINKIKELLKNKDEDNKALRLSEIKILQSQINPHFLYNTLDALNWKAIKHHDEDMENLISSLCDFYRISLSNGNEFITIEEELHHVISYLNIQNIRFKGLFEYQINCPEELKSYYSLKIIMQPIVENAIVHGLRPKGKDGKLLIDISDTEDTICISIKDNGIGMPKDKLEEILAGLNNIDLHKYGLYNVNQRICLTYGERYGLKINSVENEGTIVLMSFPKMKKENFDV